MNESKFMLGISAYSYDQYHWCPVALIEIAGFDISSVVYRIFSDGNAILINIALGSVDHISSISLFSS